MYRAEGKVEVIIEKIGLVVRAGNISAFMGGIEVEPGGWRNG